MLYVGVDAHKATAQITVMDEIGKIIKRKRIDSSSAGVSGALSMYQEPIKAGAGAAASGISDSGPFDWRLPWSPRCCRAGVNGV